MVTTEAERSFEEIEQSCLKLAKEQGRSIYINTCALWYGNGYNDYVAIEYTDSSFKELDYRLAFLRLEELLGGSK